MRQGLPHVTVVKENNNEATQMMKYTLSTAAVLLAALSTTAVAGGYTAPVVAAPVYTPVAAPAHDWSGAYVGLKAGQSSGDWSMSYLGAPVDAGAIDSGTTYGLFGGYNFQSGHMVYGAELGITKLGIGVPALPPTASIDNAFEIKGRLGYAMDRVMVYGTLGYMMSGVTDGANQYDANGMTYGVGIEFMVTNNIFAGLEYQRAALEGTYPPNDVKANIDTVALRVGFQF